MKFSFLIVAGVLGLLSSAVMASTYEGPVQMIRINTGQNGNTRVSVLVGQHASPCAADTWFAFEYDKLTDKGLGEAWTSAFMTAYAAGKTVSIQGTGNCDWGNVETIIHVDLK